MYSDFTRPTQLTFGLCYSKRCSKWRPLVQQTTAWITFVSWTLEDAPFISGLVWLLVSASFAVQDDPRVWRALHVHAVWLQVLHRLLPGRQSWQEAPQNHCAHFVPQRGRRPLFPPTQWVEHRAADDGLWDVKVQCVKSLWMELLHKMETNLVQTYLLVCILFYVFDNRSKGWKTKQLLLYDAHLWAECLAFYQQEVKWKSSQILRTGPFLYIFHLFCVDWS